MRPVRGRNGRVAFGTALGVLGLGLLLWVSSATAAATGSWSIVPSPNHGTGDNELLRVSCVSPSVCQAAGYYQNRRGTFQTLIESWNGTTWSIVPSPNAQPSDNDLSGVSCALATSCKAVGSYTSLSRHQIVTLAELWNGRSWTIAFSPNVGSASNELSGVSCLSAQSCKAVGNYIRASDGIGLTLIESWNGRSWSIVPSPNSGLYGSVLIGVSCVSATWCVAVGYYSTQFASQQTLIESWNGRTWSVVPSPNPGPHYDVLTGVSCVSATFCQAVGPSSDLAHQALVESWNGNTWSITPTPTTATDSLGLSGVSCVSVTLCQAVGATNDDVTSVGRTLIESWDGSSWSIVPTANNGTNTNYLSGVSCVSTSECRAVGGYNPKSGSSVFKTLTESNS